MTPQEEAVETYELALERARYARDEWAREGSPLTLVQTNSIVGKHPLWIALQDAESDLRRSRAVLKAADRRGRPTGTSSAPDRQKPKLKAVG